MAPAGTETLHYPPGWVWRVRFGIAASAGIAVLAAYSAIFEPPADPAGRWWLAGILVGAVAGGVALFRYHDLLSCQIRTSPEGVAHLRRNRAAFEIPWSEVGRVRRRRILGRVEIASAAGRGSILVDEHLDGFAWLLDLVERRTGRLVE